MATETDIDGAVESALNAFAAELLVDAPDTWDMDWSQVDIARQWVAHLLAEVRRLGGTTHRPGSDPYGTIHRRYTPAQLDVIAGLKAELRDR